MSKIKGKPGRKYIVVDAREIRPLAWWAQLVMPKNAA